MVVHALGATLQGVDATPIEVEIDLLRRLPSVTIVGLAAGAVREAAERVRSAITAIGRDFPKKRVVVNLAPADLRKDGAAFDLAIAAGVLAADGHLPVEALADVLLVGELALDGRIRPVRGALSMAMLARDLGRTLILPAEDAPAAARVPGASVLGAATLADALAHLRGERALGVAPATPGRAAPCHLDLADVRGQLAARRALEIAAAGAHHLMMIGPPGCGKSLLVGRGREVMRSGWGWA